MSLKVTLLLFSIGNPWCFLADTFNRMNQRDFRFRASSFSLLLSFTINPPALHKFPNFLEFLLKFHWLVKILFFTHSRLPTLTGSLFLLPKIDSRFKAI